MVGERPEKAEAPGPLIAQSESVIGIVPATCRAAPFRRAVIVTVTSCETPCMASRPMAIAVKVAPEANVELSTTGWERLNVAFGYFLVSRLVASCGSVLPPTLTVVRSMRKFAELTWLSEMAMRLVRPFVRRHC